MMMAYDSSSTPPSGLAEETILQVRSALVRYMDAPDGAGAVLGDALRAMAEEARQKSVLPEQLLVLLKDIWYGLSPSIGDPAQQGVLLQRVVTLCIKEYYGG
jgi:hypothetical protein